MWVTWFRVRLSQPQGMLLRMHRQIHLQIHTCAHNMKLRICVNAHKTDSVTHAHTFLSLIQPLTYKNIHAASGLYSSCAIQPWCGPEMLTYTLTSLIPFGQLAALHIYVSICIYPLLNFKLKVTCEAKVVLEFF